MKQSDLKKITNTNIKILIQAAQDLGIQTRLISLDPVKIEYKDKKNKATKTFILGHDLRKLTKDKQAKAISRDKLQTLKTLKQANLPVPEFFLVKTIKEYEKLIQKLPFPQVIKPLTSEKGKNVFLNIKDLGQGISAVKQIIKDYPEGCLVQTYLKAGDFRFLVLAGRVIGIVQRFAPIITADGKHTIQALIDIENEKRHQINKNLGKRMLNRMRKWERISWYLKKQHLRLDSIPEKGKKITLYPLPNFSTGGWVKAIDTNEVNKDLIDKAIKATKEIGLTIAGVDMLIKDISKPAENNNANIIEINSDPGLRLHDWPNQGRQQQTAEKVLQYIFNF